MQSVCAITDGSLSANVKFLKHVWPVVRFKEIRDAKFQAKSITLRNHCIPAKKYIGNTAYRQRLRACRARVWGKAVCRFVVQRWAISVFL